MSPRDPEKVATAAIGLGPLRLRREEAGALRDGVVIDLDSNVGDPVRILVDGRAVAEGLLMLDGDEVVVRITRRC